MPLATRLSTWRGWFTKYLVCARSIIFKCLSRLFYRPDVDFDVRLMRAVQVMDIPMLKDFINALVMDSLTYGKIALRTL